MNLFYSVSVKNSLTKINNIKKQQTQKNEKNYLCILQFSY